jgi:hypothetical protein
VRILRSQGPGSREEAAALGELSEALAALGRTAAATEALRELLALYERKGVKEDDPRVAAARRRIEELGEGGSGG